MKKLNTAIIMCAGFGKRLKPLTNKVPKPLLKIDNKSLLENTIELLFKLNINLLCESFFAKIYKFIGRYNAKHI